MEPLKPGRLTSLDEETDRVESFVTTKDKESVKVEAPPAPEEGTEKPRNPKKNPKKAPTPGITGTNPVRIVKP